MEKEKKDSTALDNIEKVMIGFFYLLGLVLFFASVATFHLGLMWFFGACFSWLAFALCHDYYEEEEE